MLDRIIRTMTAIVTKARVKAGSIRWEIASQSAVPSNARSASTVYNFVVAQSGNDTRSVQTPYHPDVARPSRGRSLTPKYTNGR